MPRKTKPIAVLALSLNLLLAMPSALHAQSSVSDITDSYALRKKLAEASSLKDYPLRSVGPVAQGGRVVDLAVHPERNKIFYVAYASGGLYKTVNNGISFEPIFDGQDALTIGDFALAPSDPDIIYVGTGENNSSRSSYAGSGVYKTTDGGKTWESLGLQGIQHTGKVLVHPKDPATVWVAALGPLYSHSAHRGVYKSTDGGKNWQKTLFINDSTGVIDLIINPENPDMLWASTWERTRKAWDFKGNGPGSALYRSDDGGLHWKRLTEGFPSGEHIGRIGLDICQTRPGTLYAVIDSQEETKTEKVRKKGDGPETMETSDLIGMDKEAFLKLDEKRLGAFLEKSGYPKKYTAPVVKEDIRSGKYTVKDVADYFGDANRALFDTKVAGSELYRSDDYGDHWRKVNSYGLQGVYFTYGYYFGEVRVDPNDADKVYIFGVPLLKSSDGGKTFARIDTLGNVHVDHQDLWIDPKDSQHLLLGNDGGLYQSYDEGAGWLHLNNLPIGQFYTVNFDMETPYNIYGGLQDNGSWVGASTSVPNRGKKWEFLFGGDGMYVTPDPRDADIVFTGFQFGNYYRLGRRAGSYEKVGPQRDIGEPALRFNWRTPLMMSRHNPDILYMGAQKLFRSLDQGKTWGAISGDLTKDHPQGNVPFSTISALSESPLRFGLVYAGTDDGNVQVAKSGGTGWTLVSGALPPDRWVSSLQASAHRESRVYVSLNGYRNDDFRTYVYVSDDYGNTWSSLKGNLPDVVVNVIVEDPVSEDLLYLGTDHGTYISLDRGKEWHLLNNIPNTASYDMKVHPRENELLIATHGRSIYVVDVKPLQKLSKKRDGTVVIAFDPSPVVHDEKWGEKRYAYLKSNIPKISIPYYLGKDLGPVGVEIRDSKGGLVHRGQTRGDRGFHHYTWDAKVQPVKSKKRKGKNDEEAIRYAGKGEYMVYFIHPEGRAEATLKIE